MANGVYWRICALVMPAALYEHWDYEGNKIKTATMSFYRKSIKNLSAGIYRIFILAALKMESDR
jgi:hypothetical protein